MRSFTFELNEKETELKNLRQNFKVLSNQNQILNEEIKILRGKNAELKSQKM